MEALATALSMIARRPVKVALTMEEQFYTITRHPSTCGIKTGVDKTGRITARKCEVYWNSGADAAGGAPARRRHSARGGGRREPPRQSRRRPQQRSARVPPQESPARRTPAGH